MNRLCTLSLITMITLSSLIMVDSLSAQSIPKPAVPEFTLRYVDHSYDVPPTYEIDPYTGTNVMTLAGYHVVNKSVDIIIENQPFTSYLNENGSRIWLFYFVAAKGHFGNWSTIDANYWINQRLSESYPPGFAGISDSQYTVITFGLGENNGTGNAHHYYYMLGNVSDGGQVDFRVQAIIGYSTRINTTFSGPPIGLEPGESYHYHTFTGKISDWSITQTLSIPDGSVSISIPTPSSNPTAIPTDSNSTGNSVTSLLTSFAFVAVAVLVGAVITLLLYVRHLKRSTIKPDNSAV